MNKDFIKKGNFGDSAPPSINISGFPTPFLQTPVNTSSLSEQINHNPQLRQSPAPAPMNEPPKGFPPPLPSSIVSDFDEQMKHNSISQQPIPAPFEPHQNASLDGHLFQQNVEDDNLIFEDTDNLQDRVSTELNAPSDIAENDTLQAVYGGEPPNVGRFPEYTADDISLQSVDTGGQQDTNDYENNNYTEGEKALLDIVREIEHAIKRLSPESIRSRRILTTEDITMILTHATHNMSVTNFCDSINISRDSYYNVVKQGKDPSGSLDIRRIAQIVGLYKDEHEEDEYLL